MLQAIGSESLNGDAPQPIDVLALQELSWVGSGSSPTLQTIVADLNSIYGAGAYAYDPTYDPTDGNLTGNGPSGLIYNTKTVQDLAAVAIGTASSSGSPRAPMRYQLQPLNDSAASFYLYVQHAKSGGSSSYTRRNTEAQEVRADAATLGASAHIIYSGDFNWDIGEPAYVTMTSSTGSWGSAGQGIDPGYSAGLLTESASSTRYRDDAQLVTAPMTNGQGGLQLVSTSYTVFGNNGSTAVGASVNLGSNTALSDLSNKSAVLTALTTATDHLPVVADYSFTLPATISLSSVVSATVITGGTAILGTTVVNSASAGSSNLNYTLAAAVQSGGATLGTVAPGATGTLAPGASQACTVSATSTNLGVNAVSFTASDPNASNLSQTTTAALTVLGNRVVTASAANFGLVHVGAAVSQPVTLSTSGGDNYYTRVTVGNAGPDANGISVTGGTNPLFNDSSVTDQRTLGGTFNTVGTVNGSITLPTLGEGLVGEAPINVPVSYAAQVYSGKAQWSATSSGDWGNSGNWNDTAGGGPSGAPGMLGYATDTATFGPSVPSGVAVVSLNSAAPLLSSLVFNDSTAGYSIVQGSGTTGLTLASSDSGSPAVVTVLSGTHSVLAPILLNSNLEVSSSGSLTLGGNIDDGGLGQGLTLAGSGTLILSGTNTFSGGTMVVGGVLDLANRTSLLDGSSLTVGADAASIFAPSLSLAPALTPAAVPAPVPEPGALALLATAAAGCAGVWSGVLRPSRLSRRRRDACTTCP